MTDHYYTAEPTLAHDEHTFTFNLLGNDLKFTSDAGVFSKQTIDFGTRTMLEAFDADKIPDGRILDLGAGYGPVAISLAKVMPERQFVAAEVNHRAVDLIKRNAEANRVLDQIEIVQSDIYQAVQDRFAAIMVNPPVRAGKAVVQTMLREAHEHLLPGGTLTVVLQKKQGAPSAKALMDETFGNVQTIDKAKGYYVMESVYDD
ncbi:16S rRNA (guanine1207-N2)-methyltransferase [Weissella uvarum]|uniref:class I SAM-dependent methyltransferase n=1 Tax=Weissella uvarum TaxID=1479233 RepID=UPI00195FFA42|nr:class I SAM-dependent methyltransferase [Weissella uvarum]MBM7616800.1 16S rRNA (guanine1207-N2)-methyltransferase [Weissella uvarum]MCM0594746.1 class I SAM-dependent methyltransferase [Weissella uvarum]